MKKKCFWYPVANLRNRFLFGSYGKDVYVEPGVFVNRPRFVHIGNHVRIKKDTTLNLHPRNKRSKEGLLFIGNNVSISGGCLISAFNKIVIEDNVLIGPNVMIIDNTRKPGDINYPIKDQELEIGSVHIGTDSWIAYNACILPNVTIGRHCTIGALSVVNCDIPPYSVAVGAPARVVKQYDFQRKEWVRVDESRDFMG